jgi:hypothetical protein
MAEKQVPINQTQFSFEEPIFEDKAVYIDEKSPKKITKPLKSKKKIIIIIGIIGFVLIMIFLVIAQSMTEKQVIVEDSELLDVAVVKELGPLKKRIDDARQQLNLADPTKQDLSFPPIDMKIRLDPEKR